MKFETVYKFRFLPLTVCLTLLIVSSILEYGASVDTGDWLVWSILLTIVGWIYYRGVIQHKNEKAAQAELIRNPPPPPTQVELRQTAEEEIDNNISVLKNNIIIRSVVLFMCLFFLTGVVYICFIQEEVYLYGSIGTLFLIGATVYSIHLLKKYRDGLKYFKEEKRKISQGR